MNPDEMSFDERPEVDPEVAKATRKVFSTPPADPSPAAQAVIDKFTKEAEAEIDALADDPVPLDGDEFGPLTFKEPCPEMAEALKKVRDRLKRLGEIEKTLTAEAKRLCEADKKREDKKWSVQLGGRTLIFQKREGAMKVDEGELLLHWLEDVQGVETRKEAEAEIARRKAIVAAGGDDKFVSKAKGSVSLEVA